MIVNMTNSAAGPWVPGEEEGDIGKPPETVKKFLEEKGSQGIIMNGVIAWILANRENGATGIWKQIIEHHYGLKEVLEARNLLNMAVPTLKDHVTPMKKARQVMSYAVDDIILCFEFLTENKTMMPLVLATTEQWLESPQSMGSISPEATMGEMASKVQKLEEVMGEFGSLK